MSYLPAFTEQGVGDPLVLVMGLGAPGSLWQPHVDAWAEQFRCILIDNRGMGESPDDGRPLSIEQMAADVAHVIEHLQLGASRVAGISMGSAITQQLALDRPDLVAKIALIAPWSRASRRAGLFFSSVVEAARVGDIPLYRHLLVGYTRSSGWLEAHPDETEEMLRDPAEVPFDLVARQARACAAFDVVDRLPGLSVPTLVTLGVEDLIIPPEDSRETARLIPGAELVEFSSGHVHHWEELDTFNTTVKEWLLR